MNSANHSLDPIVLQKRIAELKTELKIWWDENVKNKIACQRKDDRIAELEAALRFYADDNYNGYNGDGAHARAVLEGKNHGDH